ncbi:hypothetical protein PoB_000009100 [Plakobranchus ocellatus]|uniref:Uncharacterized protein n=1 Tax=Plakobranchus ocellatus TaxID=259542 RepID=A0AAV3XU21_9GAST|nr:hypothetical protein PoB_000009100 [Plakobranchus ocellatus]
MDRRRCLIQKIKEHTDPCDRAHMKRMGSIWMELEKTTHERRDAVRRARIQQSCSANLFSRPARVVVFVVVFGASPHCPSHRQTHHDYLDYGLITTDNDLHRPHWSQDIC